MRHRYKRNFYEHDQYKVVEEPASFHYFLIYD